MLSTIVLISCSVKADDPGIFDYSPTDKSRSTKKDQPTIFAAQGKSSMNNTPSSTFGLVVREIREELGLSQEALAMHSGLDRTFISLLERGRRQPSLSTILFLAFSLDVPPCLLISKVQERLPEEFMDHLQQTRSKAVGKVRD